MAIAVLLVGGVALAATVECVVGAEQREGTEEADTLKGTPEKDTLRGLKGNDKLYANEGDDDMSGGLGNDLMRGGRGEDGTLLWNVPPGETPNAGNDTIYGGSGNDFILDREGSNLSSGGSGSDQVASTGEVFGGPGDDWRVYSYSTEDAEGNVIIKGRAIGGSREDLVRVSGTGTMLGGPGDDTFDKRPCRDLCRSPRQRRGAEGPQRRSG